MALNPSTVGEGQTLAARIPAARAKNFLVALANLHDGAEPASWFQRHFGSLFLDEVPWERVREWKIKDLWDVEASETSTLRWSNDQLLLHYWLPNLRDAIRGVWRLEDSMSREWAVLTIIA